MKKSLLVSVFAALAMMVSVNSFAQGKSNQGRLQRNCKTGKSFE
ncbi:hypothetical protein NXV73_06860 [Bacteroides salyersiae]|nr:hypothetical protein [Bacteroides salyersiae]